MFLWQSAFFAMSLLLTSSFVASFKESIIKNPDECKGQHLCTIKPEGYHHLEANIESWLPKYLMKGPIKVFKRDVRSSIREVERYNHNCREERVQGLMYTYFYNKTNPNDYEILVQNKRFQQNIDVVKCRQPDERLTANSNEQCFQQLGISTYNLKSKCETITTIRPLFVFNEDRTRIIKKYLKVPVACSCMVSYLSENDFST